MQTTQPPEITQADVRPKFRDDLIRRLFAIAISVGFAASLVKMQWIQDGRAPSINECKQIYILLIAMIVTVLSWDGYLWAIHTRPLVGFWRFAIDISLVFIYMFLFLTSNHNSWWLPIVAVIFILYSLWDLLTVLEYTSYYGADSVGGVYFGGLVSNQSINPSPVITITWAACIVAMAYLTFGAVGEYVFAAGTFTIISLVLYRTDKAKRFSMILRLILVTIIVLFLYVYRSYKSEWTDSNLLALITS